MTEVFCNQCGHRNPLGANFCSSCGAPLEHEPGERTTITFSIDVPPEAGEDEITFDLDDITVSRRHAELQRVESGFVVRDVGSLNGTYLNRERVEEGPIKNGDELQIGKFKLAFFAGPSPA